MELCHGRDLKETLKLEGKLDETRAVRIIATIADALAAAHALGVIHRDLKPENVMVESDRAANTDVVKVLDFGIAKLVDAQPKAARQSSPDSDPPPALTQFGVVVGTPAYMSPEQCRGQPLDGRSDLYTCGILLYQLVTGVLPFNSESPFELAGKQAFEPPPPPSQHLPTIDKDLERIILRLLSKTPDERNASAIDLRDTLVSWLERRAAPPPALPGGARPDIRGLSRTVPMSAVAANVQEYLRQQLPPPDAPPPPGLAQMQGGQMQGAQMQGPFAPMGQGQRGPMDTAVDPAPPAASYGQGQQQGGIAPAMPMGPAPGGTESVGDLLGRGGPMEAGAQPGMPAEGSMGQPALPPIVIVKKQGWGALGVVCILFSLIAGVALGAGVFRFMGGPLPFFP
jgi:hypothetical protein